MNDALKTVGIYPAEKHQKLQAFLSAVAEVEPVQFRPVTDLRDSTVDALIVIDDPSVTWEKLSSVAKRVFVFFSDAPVDQNVKRSFVFSRSNFLTPVLRGQSLESSCALIETPLTTRSGDILATAGDKPVWLRLKTEQSAVDVLAAASPGLSSASHLYLHLRDGCFIGLLPLLHFLKEITGELNTLPPMRACFMFDDPNLHWKTFGFIRYQPLVESAIRENYHVTFATVPLDGWFIHRPTAELFQKNSDRLSFLIHGNNHTRRELAADYTPERQLQLIAESLSRIENLERRSGLRIPRVMAAPHGACKDSMASTMLRCGYEAACISRSSIMSANRDRSWKASTGLHPSAFLGSGLPVIPRFGLHPGCQTDIILAAFLGQPIIPVGHHQDVPKGYGMLDELARFINRLGTVHWTNLEEMARSNARFWRHGSTGYVEMYSRHLEFQFPQGVSSVVIRRPWLKDVGAQEPLVIESGNGKADELVGGWQSAPVAVPAHGKVVLKSKAPDVVNHASVPKSAPQAWPILRRLLAEGRDRFQGLSGAFHRG